jgi:hypothetical protein
VYQCRFVVRVSFICHHNNIDVLQLL